MNKEEKLIKMKYKKVYRPIVPFFKEIFERLDEIEAKYEVLTTPRPRGRPKGSKNKMKNE